VLTPEAETAWKNLRQFTMYYLGYSGSSSKDDAVSSMFAFARACEKENLTLMTSQLHTAICRLPAQEEVLGRPFHLGELWMEREIRAVGSTDTVSAVEETLAKRQLMHEAIERVMCGSNFEFGSGLLEYHPRDRVRNTGLFDTHGELKNNNRYKMNQNGKEFSFDGQYIANAAKGKGVKDDGTQQLAIVLQTAIQEQKSDRIPFLYRSLKKEDFIVREGDAKGAIDDVQNLYVVVVSKTPIVEEVPSSG